MFLICAAVLLASGVIYVLFADSTLQSWNQPKVSGRVTGEKEMSILKDSAKTDLVNGKNSTHQV